MYPVHPASLQPTSINCHHTHFIISFTTWPLDSSSCYHVIRAQISLLSSSSFFTWRKIKGDHHRIHDDLATADTFTSLSQLPGSMDQDATPSFYARDTSHCGDRGYNPGYNTRSQNHKGGP